MSAPLIEARGLVVEFHKKAGPFSTPERVHAVNGVDLSLLRGEVVGLVGESGSGKSTLGRSLLRLYEPTAGAVLFDGQDISHIKERALRPLRRRMQLVFQDPQASLNPRMSVETMLSEAITFHQIVPAAELDAYLNELLEVVGLGKDMRRRYPHELSGGQRQRLGIARAISVKPELLIADEPVSALDVSIRAQILELLATLKQRYGLTMLFIAHDLEVVRAVCDRVLVMYLGRIVESLPSADLFERARHPYTRALISAVPKIEAEERPQARARLEGEPPSPLVLPAGCAFASRCPLAEASCRTVVPPLTAAGAGHSVACPVVLRAL